MWPGDWQCSERVVSNAVSERGLWVSQQPFGVLLNSKRPNEVTELVVFELFDF